MFKKQSTYLSRNDEDFKVALEAMQLLRKQFLTLPFDEFVDMNRIWQSLSKHKKVTSYLSALRSRLDFGTDSYRYFMQYLRDEETAEVVDREASHNIHTDFRGRCEIRRVDTVLAYAMGFSYLDEKLGVEEFGYEADPGYVEETVSTEQGEVLISGYKNSNGNYHGYCQIQQADGAVQRCFFDDGTILARRIYYTNGMSEDVRDDTDMVVDPFAYRIVYEITDNKDGVVEFEETAIEKDTAEEIFNILGGYSLEMEWMHEVEYPYQDEPSYEKESDRCVPGLNMAILKDEKLWGVVLKTNKYDILPLDSFKYASDNRFETYVIALDDDFCEDELKISLKKASKTEE